MTSHFQKTLKTAISEEIQKENTTTTRVATTTTIVARETQTGNRKYDRVFAKTAPNFNDCVATIDTRPFTPTVKGGGIVNSAFRRGKKGVIFRDSGIRRGLET